MTIPSATAGQRQRRGLDQELGHDVRLPGTDRHPDADLAHALEHRDTSMMFMMPMPPTSSETDAIAATRVAKARVEVSLICSTSARFSTEKSSSWPAAE